MFGLIRNIDFLITAVVISVILLVSSNLRYKRVSKANKSFTASLVLMLISCLIEILVTVTRTYPSVFPPFVMHIMRSSYSIANGMLALFVYRYARSYSESFETHKNWADISTYIIATLYSLISIIDIPTGIVTWFEEDGTYVHGPLYIVTYAGVGLVMLSALVATIKDRKYYTKSQFISINILFSITAVCTVVEILIESRSLLIMFGITIGLLIVFTSLETPDYAKAVAAKNEAEAARNEALTAKDEAEKAKYEAEMANNAKSDFLARMSHEIRTPMNAIMGMNEMIINSTCDEQAKVYSADAYNAAHNLLDIINEILDFSRIESGKLNLMNDKYSLTTILRDIWVINRAKCEEKGLEIKFEIDPKLNDCYYGDKVRLRQILINLLTNAIKYTDEGKVTLRISLCDDSALQGVEKSNSEATPVMVKYEVIDTGRGIKDEDKVRLYEAFTRIEEHRSTTITGTGLGINITTSLLNLMGSKLEVESEYGKGSTFSFSIIQNAMGDEKVGNYETVELQEVVLNDSKTSVAGKKILCVDDTTLNLKVFRAFLKNTELEIDLAESAKDALVLTLKNKYDLIFMDYLMPEIDGIQCFNMIKNQEGGLNCDTPEIVLTANAIKGAEEKYKDMGFIDSCFKPYSKDDLIKIINKYLA